MVKKYNSEWERDKRPNNHEWKNKPIWCHFCLTLSRLSAWFEKKNGPLFCTTILSERIGKMQY